MPNSRQTPRIPSSIPRETSEYSICKSHIGCTAAARLIAAIAQQYATFVGTLPHGSELQYLHIVVVPAADVNSAAREVAATREVSAAGKMRVPSFRCPRKRGESQRREGCTENKWKATIHLVWPF